MGGREPCVRCFDSGPLMTFGRVYPPDVFRKLWSNFHALSKSGRRCAPMEVLREIEAGDDQLVRWVRPLEMFRHLDVRQLAVVREVLRQFPSIVDPGKETPDADPFVVALARVEGEAKDLYTQTPCVVVTSEKSKPNRVRIPDVCRYYELEAIDHLEFFRRVRWQF